MKKHLELSQDLQAVKVVCTEESEVSQLKLQMDNLKKQVIEAKSKRKACKGKTEKLERLHKQMTERLRAQERYSPKEYLLICNHTFDASKSQKTLHDTMRFFKCYLDIDYSADRIESYHVLTSSGKDFLNPAAIANFCTSKKKILVLLLVGNF